MKILSYLFYLVAILAAFTASFEILVQMFPDYGLFHMLVGFIGTAMFFSVSTLIPSYILWRDYLFSCMLLEYFVWCNFRK